MPGLPSVERRMLLVRQRDAIESRREGQGEAMSKLLLAIVTVALVSSGTAFAQSTPRSVCCKEMNGRWEENRRTKEMRCFGVDGNRYYQCVAKRTGR
jgi:hypothetical protein